MAALVVVSLTGCSGQGAIGVGGPTPPPGPSITGASPSPSLVGPVYPLPTFPAGCNAGSGGVTPDPVCTPGAVNPDVTPNNMAINMCRNGWAPTIRPPLSWSSTAKKRAMKAYGIPKGTSMTGYELDHLIPLTLGGAPADPRNLWPELGASPNRKDAVEAAARAAVCHGRMPLRVAQGRMAKDWRGLGRTLGVKVT